MIGVDRQHLLIGGYGVVVSGGVVFKRDTPGEHLGDVLGVGLRPHQREWLAADDFRGSKIEHELSGNWLDDFAFVTEGNPVSGRKRARFEERICHSGGLLLHCGDGLTDDRGANPLSAKIPHLLYLK